MYVCRCVCVIASSCMNMWMNVLALHLLGTCFLPAGRHAHTHTHAHVRTCLFSQPFEWDLIILIIMLQERLHFRLFSQCLLLHFNIWWLHQQHFSWMTWAIRYLQSRWRADVGADADFDIYDERNVTVNFMEWKMLSTSNITYVHIIYYMYINICTHVIS